MFASRYGTTLEEFYSLTSRQIFSIKRVIERETRNELRLKASLHGKELKNDLPEPLDIDNETRREYDKQASDLMLRMKQRKKDFDSGGKR